MHLQQGQVPHKTTLYDSGSLPLHFLFPSNHPNMWTHQVGGHSQAGNKGTQAHKPLLFTSKEDDIWHISITSEDTAEIDSSIDSKDPAQLFWQ